MATTETGARGGARQESPLAALRREAGWRSAREFAQALGMPTATYARYERTISDPGSGAPVRAARAIADALGCTIDAVVGREAAAPAEGRSIDAAYRALSEGGRERLDEYLQFLALRDRVLAARGR